jgi:hypothetical protein
LQGSIRSKTTSTQAAATWPMLQLLQLWLALLAHALPQLST